VLRIDTICNTTRNAGHWLLLVEIKCKTELAV